jgi:F-type H+-transporting ATPase subunit a
MPEQLWFTAFLNHYLAAPVSALLNALHMPPEFPQAPITNGFAMEIFSILVLLVLFVLVRISVSVENPGAVQHLAEALESFVDNQMEEVMGHKTPQFAVFIATLFVFILMMNVLGLVPSLDSPTATPTVPLGLAVTAWIYYHVHGVKKQGLLKYLKHFFGPIGSEIPWFIRYPMYPLMLVIEVISHAARMLSLTVRLWANMFAGDMITLVFLSLIPLLLPVIFLSLHAFVAFLQAYIFMLLAIVYLQGATAEEH